MNQQVKFNAPFLYGSTGLQRGLSIFELTIGYMSRIRPKKSMDQVWSSAFFFQVSLIGSLATVLWIVATSTMLRWMKMLICAEWSECDYFLFISTTISINCIWAFFFLLAFKSTINGACCTRQMRAYLQPLHCSLLLSFFFVLLLQNDHWKNLWRHYTKRKRLLRWSSFSIRKIIHEGIAVLCHCDNPIYIKGTHFSFKLFGMGGQITLKSFPHCCCKRYPCKFGRIFGVIWVDAIFRRCICCALLRLLLFCLSSFLCAYAELSFAS